MAFKNFKGEIERNLQEQVRANKDHDIALAKEIQSLKTLVGFDIKVIERLDTWVEPIGNFAFGDAIAVGPEGGPFNFYIYTRYSADAENGYWLNYGPISIVGPQGPQGEQGPEGEPGKSSKWFVGSDMPTDDVHENDMWLKVNVDGSTNGLVYQYGANGWVLFTSIMGPRGLQGPEGKQGKQGPIGLTGPAGKDGNPSPVINIIGELPEGSVISDTYDPSTVASNSGILMPVGGVNHLWIIINGMWTDSGSWGQGGTRVYEDGQQLVEFNADVKVDKQNPGFTALYGVGDTGKSFMAKLAHTGVREGNAVPRYGPGGQLETANPQTAYQCANKNYVDTKIAAAHSNDHHSMNLAFDKVGASKEFIIPFAFLYDQFVDLPMSTHGNINGRIQMPCEFYYNISGSWYLAGPFAWLEFYMIENDGTNVKVGIVVSEAGTTNATVEAVGTLDSQTKTLSISGQMIEGQQGAPASEVRIVLILPPDESVR